MKNKYIKIQSINKFTKHMAKDLCKTMDIDYKNLKEYMSFRQAKNLVKQYSRKGKDGLYINEKRFAKLAEEFHDWVLGIDLCKMCSSGELDCYWDNDRNKMVFKANKNTSDIFKFKEGKESK